MWCGESLTQGETTDLGTTVQWKLSYDTHESWRGGIRIPITPLRDKVNTSSAPVMKQWLNFKSWIFKKYFRSLWNTVCFSPNQNRFPSLKRLVTGLSNHTNTEMYKNASRPHNTSVFPGFLVCLLMWISMNLLLQKIILHILMQKCKKLVLYTINYSMKQQKLMHLSQFLLQQKIKSCTLTH